MAQKRKPDRVDVVIIGAGASGATAAKVLTERGMRVVALERGPWRKRESFGGDELANVNRYNLWPDPILNPRTLRASVGEEAEINLFCPVPQMVGGGTVHWQGWLPRFTESDFNLRSIVGDVPGATLVDWPISYADLEPYYTEVEWAFGVSGAGGVNKFEGFRSKEYPCPPLPATRYGQKFHEGCRKLGYNSFPTPMAALSRPYNGRPVTVQSAFAQQHGDPTGTRSSALSVFIPDALKTGRYDLRPDCYVHEITVDERGRCRSAVYQDAEGSFIEQEADTFILSCGAIESARLLLLSRSGRFPHGLANGSDLVGRNATFHEFSAAVGVFEDPIYAWAGGGYVAASSFQFYEHDENRASSAGAILHARVSAFRCQSTGACRVARHGEPRRSRSIGTFTTTASPSRWSCTICPNMITAWILTIGSRMRGACPSHALPTRSTKMTLRWAAGLSIITPRYLMQPARRKSTAFISTALRATVLTSTAPRAWATILNHPY
jgi:choline dehydrogenase-like flavoprotein